LRREPRRDGLSTIEAAAMLVSRLEGRPEIEATLNAGFERLLERYRAMQRQARIGGGAAAEDGSAAKAGVR